MPTISAEDNQSTNGTASAIDSGDNRYFVFGSTAASVVIGNQTFTNETACYLTKFNSAGEVTWTNAITGGGIAKVVTDEANNVYCMGSFLEEITLGNGISLSSENVDPSLFLVKYDSNGNVVWAKKSEAFGDDIYYINVMDMAIDLNNNLYITGSFTGSTIVFDNITITSTGSHDGFIAKYDQNGNALWARKGAGDAFAGESFFIDTDGSGNVYIGGNFLSPSMTLDTITLTSAPSAYITSFVAKYNPAGTIQWAKKYGNFGVTSITGINLDSQNNICIGGVFNGAYLSIDNIVLNNTLDTNGGAYSSDVYILKMNDAGNLIWARSMGGPDFENIMEIAVDALDNIYISGYSRSPQFTFYNYTFVNQGTANGYACKISPLGECVWGTQLGGTGLNDINSIAFDSLNNVYFGGNYSGNMMMGDMNYTAHQNVFFAQMHQLILSVTPASHLTSYIFPNPARDFINLRSPLGFSYIISDCSGKILLDGSTSDTKVDVSSLSSGMYIATINGVAQKFIKE